MLIRREVIVNLKTDKAFRGILWSVRRRYVVLKKATLIEAGQQTEVPGEVVVERTNIDFVQAVPA